MIMPSAPKRPPPVRRLYKDDSGFLGDRKDLDPLIINLDRYLDDSTSDYNSSIVSAQSVDDDDDHLLIT